MGIDGKFATFGSPISQIRMTRRERFPVLTKQFPLISNILENKKSSFTAGARKSSSNS
jgi:hypothetical protein